MSIIGQAADAQNALWVNGVFLVLAVAALAFAARLGAFRRGSIVGPPRMGERDTLGPLAVLLGGGFMLWILAQIACLIPVGRAAQSVPAGPATTRAAANAVVVTTAPVTHDPVLTTAPTSRPAPVVSRLSPGRMALMSSLPALLAWGFLMMGNVYLRPGGLGGLGLSLGHVRRGVRTGLIASCIAIPIVFGVAELTDVLWNHLHYTHPREHDLLRLLGESGSPLVAATLIAAAVVVAPLFEEVLFRGHLQTLVTYALSRFRQRIAGQHAARGFDVLPPSVGQGGIAGPGADAPSGTFDVVAPDGQGGVAGGAPPLPYREPTRYARWASVIFASLAFSAVHPAWTIPPIFLLSVCLGYVYERTGNLWATITMHATFNATSTILYLSFMH